MKKLFSVVATLLFAINMFAQAPQKMSYQTVVRNGSGALITSSPIGIKISLLQGSISGTVVFAETHSATTNANGLASLEIGGGSVTTGTFAAIDWANGPYFIKTETDITGGTNYMIVGISQFMSVPYALFAGNAPKTHTIGEAYGGGIIFYVYDNGQHGLIAATQDQSTAMRWYGGNYTKTWAKADGIGAGKSNTTLLASQGSTDGEDVAATVCNRYSVTVNGVTYGDWYLPSRHELNLLYLQKNVVGGFVDDVYWSSTESGLNNAWDQDFSTGTMFEATKHFTNYIRAIRAF